MTARMWAVALVAALGGCTRPAPPPRRVTLPDRPRIAVLPFRLDAELGSNAELEPRGSGVAGAADLSSEAARTLAARLADAGLAVVDPDLVLATLPLVDTGEYGPRLGARVAKKVGANLAVIGAISRYREREGTAWSARTPASVAYQAALVRAADGIVLMIDRFDYTQHALTENLLDLPRFLRGGGRWLTGQEILDGAFQETAARFAGTLGAAAPR